MQNVNTKLPIFPLPVFILPGGITRLRIFEPRYLKMVKIATQEKGFVIWLNSGKSKDIKSENLDILWGSWVEIINFDQGEDGILEIDVKCKSLVEILSTEKDNDNLNFGVVSEISHWSQQIEESADNNLSESLVEVFNNNKLLDKLYVDKATNNTHWVVARWLELIPVDLDVKTSFFDGYNFEEAESFVSSIIYRE
jgi:Lon protease-like protein